MRHHFTIGSLIALALLVALGTQPPTTVVDLDGQGGLRLHSWMCGPASLHIAFGAIGIEASVDELIELTQCRPPGVSMQQMMDGCKAMEVEAHAVNMSYRDISKSGSLAIVLKTAPGADVGHFITARGDQKNVHIVDPAHMTSQDVTEESVGSDAWTKPHPCLLILGRADSVGGSDGPRVMSGRSTIQVVANVLTCVGLYALLRLFAPLLVKRLRSR